MKFFKKIGAWFSSHRPTKRRIIQLYAALLTNANLKGFGSGKIYQGNVKKICAPGLNCYSCPGASAACPLGALQNALASSGKTVPYYIFGIILLFGFLFGRWICGFLCPFGLLQDLLHKIKTPKIRKNRFTRILSYLKYVILVVFVIILPLIYAAEALDFPLPAFCKYICPSGTLLGAGGLLSNESNSTMLMMLGPLFTWKFCLLVAFIVGSIFLYRFFCRFFCPLGALYGFFNKISLLGMKVDPKSCTDCGICVEKCGMDIRKVGDHECISCGDCVDVCPTNAITRKGPKLLLPPNEIGGRTAGARVAVQSDELLPGTKPLPKRTKISRAVVAVLLLALLGGALYYYNFVDGKPAPSVVPPDETTAEQEDASGSGETTDPIDPAPSLGNKVGDLCYSYDLSLIGKDGTVSVESTRGTITVINFWGTWCGPCKHELIYEFPSIEETYGDAVKVIAVHSEYLYNESDALSWIEGNMPADSSIIFAVDGEDDVYCKELGGGQSWPHTLILDEEGVIISVLPYAVTFEGDLKPILDAAIAAE